MAQQEQAWANSGPWALLAVSVLTACVGAVHAGLIPASTAPLLVGILLACSLPQLIGAIIAFRRGEILLASIAGLFGTVITLGAAITLWEQVFKAPAPGAFTPEAMGVFWITLFVITEIFAVGFGRASWLLLAGIAEVGVAFLFLGNLRPYRRTIRQCCSWLPAHHILRLLHLCLGCHTVGRTLPKTYPALGTPRP